MNLFIDIQTSKALPRVLITLWTLLCASGTLYIALHFSLLTTLILLLSSVLIFIPCALWQLKALNRMNQGVKQLQFIDGCWYLLMKRGLQTQKYAIELANDNVLWPWWIRLGYRLEQDEQPLIKRFPIFKKQQTRQLLIYRDAVSETDFRHLSRVLRFYRNEDEVVNQE